MNERILIVEKNYASGEQDRIANELSRINVKKVEVEKLFTTIMNEFRDKSSHLTILETQVSQKKSQSNRLDDEEHSLNLERQELETKIQELEKQIEPKNEVLVKLRQKEQDLISYFWFIYWGTQSI